MESFQIKLFKDCSITRWPQIHKLLCSAISVCQRFVSPQIMTSQAVKKVAISHCRNCFQYQNMLKLCSCFQDCWEHFEDPFCSTTMEILSDKVATGKGLGVSWNDQRKMELNFCKKYMQIILSPLTLPHSLVIVYEAQEWEFRKHSVLLLPFAQRPIFKASISGLFFPQKERLLMN